MSKERKQLPYSKFRQVGKKVTKKECDTLLRKLCLLKTNHKSELSGKSDTEAGIILQVHHLIGKPNYFLRYHLENCIVLTQGEHKWGIHNPNREEEFRAKIKTVKGQDIYEKLEYFKKLRTETKLSYIKLYLENEIKILKEKNEYQNRNK